MTHLGDITKISGHTAPVVDCVIGGSPCQDVSVAGQRAGLAGERSGLLMHQLRIVREMREEDRKRGRTGSLIRPRFMVWENVPGAFSSNGGRDFQTVLSEIIRIAEPEAPDVPLPPKGKWPLADAYYGDGWSVAYRVLDAQFWGVPQRRRRITLVTDFGGHAAPEILFERESVSGNIETGGQERETAGSPAGSGADLAIGSRTNYLTGWDCQEKRIFTPLGVAPTLSGCDRGGRTGCGYIFCRMAAQQGGAEIRTDDKAPVLTAAAGMSGNNQPVICLMDQGGNVMETILDRTGTLRAQEHGHPPLVLAFKAGAGAKAGGIGLQEEVAPTLAACESGTNQTPAIAVLDEDVTFDLAQVTSPVNRSKGCVGVSCTLSATGRPGVITNSVVRRLAPLECERLQGYPDGWTALPEIQDMTDEAYVFWRNLLLDKAIREGKVRENDTGTYEIWRKVTILNDEGETEEAWENTHRLYKHKTKEQMVRWYNKSFVYDTDSARYKALGNSIALPQWKWILKRIDAHYERDATMASLFDGIGGFPLLWEQINGPGSCLWASEIEEFPVAVTRYHFGEA